MKSSKSIFIGSASGHAGEFLQGSICDGGELRRVLISIPAPGLRSSAIFTASERNGLRVTPPWKLKSLKAFQLAWLQFSRTMPCGTLTIQSDIPVSHGMGSSTADCVAAIRAAASYWDCELQAGRIAMVAHQAECFCDATMYEDRLVVFQHCDGRIYEYLGGEIPNLRLLIVGLKDGGPIIDTDTMTRPDYTAEEIQQFTECLSLLRSAAATNNVQEIARIARISAQINQKYHPKQKMNEVEQIAAENNALGVAVAHSGDIQILLYPPSSLSEQVLHKVCNDLEVVGMKCWRVLSTLREQETGQISPLLSVDDEHSQHAEE
jgi:uncharacterized protein involved in propanediol utilization